MYVQISNLDELTAVDLLDNRFVPPFESSTTFLVQREYNQMIFTNLREF